jgi:hypothetical protein
MGQGIRPYRGYHHSFRNFPEIGLLSTPFKDLYSERKCDSRNESNKFITCNATIPLKLISLYALLTKNDIYRNDALKKSSGVSLVLENVSVYCREIFKQEF